VHKKGHFWRKNTFLFFFLLKLLMMLSKLFEKSCTYALEVLKA
jgi:hypothetical protein